MKTNRRTSLKLFAASGIITTAASQAWTKPIISHVLLPSHAAASRSPQPTPCTEVGPDCPITLDIDPQTCSASSQDFIITNNSDFDVNIIDITMTSGGISISPAAGVANPQLIAAGDSLTFTVSYEIQVCLGGNGGYQITQIETQEGIYVPPPLP